MILQYKALGTADNYSKWSLGKNLLFIMELLLVIVLLGKEFILAASLIYRHKVTKCSQMASLYYWQIRAVLT